MPGKLTVDGVKDTLAGAGLEQALLERPDRCPVRYLTTGTQSDKALEAQAVEQLEFHLFVAQVEQLLDQQDANHEFGRERRTPAAFAAGAGSGFINRIGKRDEVDMLLHHLERITKLVQLGFAFLVGKQTRLDHEIRSATGSRYDATAGSVFRGAPKYIIFSHFALKFLSNSTAL